MQEDNRTIYITINIITGNVTGSAIIQGGDCNKVTVTAGSLPPEVTKQLLKLLQKIG